MARSMNQSSAWLAAFALSVGLFAAGLGAFKMMVKDGKAAQGTGGGRGEEHVAASHGDEPAKAEHAEATKDDHTEAKHGDAHEAATPHEPASSEPGKKEGHGEEEGEISADQFKAKDHH